ncbi:MAG: TraR/DksA family transcriptional regulator [Pseudomonadota bacterium]
MIDTDAMKAKLEARLVELGARLEHIEHDLDEPLPKDAEDRAIELEDDEVLEQLGQAGQMEIRAIKDALGRIRHGTYGICVNCGARISDARLYAVPHATLCHRCL